ncbi:sigma 54-interacting transcriptional regulator [Salipaludibacillus sp. CUR1]|uniref:sigma-54 interaction domain-containing protein n=1 Tax=Salipaludibacillus sp. CUR1 TaxID=2820003 RepID=UPI001E59D662|nr:sigma 54-interacting transcriptional regulator [Salipaludibacillus sp. CUR1]MCE7794127.1 sigma 54-interacting transcriptional regulator [Salipaludibacillus sp. CUR1]
MAETLSAPALPSVYRQLLDAIDVGIHVINHEGKSIIYNRKMSEIEDMEKEDVLHKNIMDIFLFNKEEESRLLQALNHGEEHHNAKQVYFNFKGQEITTINDTFPLIYEGKRIGAVEVAKDITRLERLTRENARDKQDARFTFDQIIGDSNAIREVVENARRATRTTSSVLISGETGTGKELFAQSIHNGSERASKPFISQNCAALPDSLIEGILFGSVKGAFTGAADHPGLFEQADGGTLMLDEINSLSAPLQAKLLRAIQEKSIRRIGDTKNRSVDVRIIATINEDPAVSLEKNRLREDLYYRLSVVSILVPPLRQRKEDIPVLANHFVNKYNKRFQLNVPGIAKGVQQLFQEYDWPGNVRELEHMVEGAMNLIYYDERIDYTHLPVHVRNKFPSYNDISHAPEALVVPNTPPTKPLQEYMEEVEKVYIEQILKRHSGNVTQAADELGLSRQSLQYRLRKYRLNIRQS